MRATFGRGPVGTGAYLVGHQGPWSEPREAEVWLLLLFFPLVPLSRWVVGAAPGSEGTGEGATLELAVHSRARVGVRAALRRVARAVGVALLLAAPFAFAAAKVGSPWATPLFSALLGSVLSPGLLGKLGMAVELGALLAGAALPVAVLALLDERTPRVPLRVALGR